jgi:soluble lytic murein transglycosylase-like protein
MNSKRGVGSRVTLALLAMTMGGAAVASTDTPAVPAAADSPSDAASPLCKGLAADAQRLASKFKLGLAACLSGAEAREPASPRSAERASWQAQQLYLYDTDPASVPGRVSGATLRPYKVDPGRDAKPAAPRLSVQAGRALRLAPTVDATARAHGIDPLLLHAIARVESGHNSSAVSPAGARGVMQLMPATASRFGVATAQALHDAPTNVAASAAYLKTLQQRFGNDLALVLAAYNAGEGAVERHGRRVPPYPETQGYVRNVLAEYALLRRAAGHSARRSGMKEVRL